MMVHMSKAAARRRSSKSSQLSRDTQHPLVPIVRDKLQTFGDFAHLLVYRQGDHLFIAHPGPSDSPSKRMSPVTDSNLPRCTPVPPRCHPAARTTMRPLKVEAPRSWLAPRSRMSPLTVFTRARAVPPAASAIRVRSCTQSVELRTTSPRSPRTRSSSCAARSSAASSWPGRR